MHDCGLVKYFLRRLTRQLPKGQCRALPSMPSCLSTSSFSTLHGPITQFTQDEAMIRDAARQWARNELQPHVRQMDNQELLSSSMIQSLFDHGFMGMVRTTIFWGGIHKYLVS